jgi:hypothetical protein
MTAAALALTPSVHADGDTDFADELHGYGIYGQRDYNAWLAKAATRERARDDKDHPRDP